MTTKKFSNDASALLAVSLGISDTSVQIASGAGALFPSLGAGESFTIALEDALGDIEFCECTARVGDVLTVTRGQEGSSPQTWTASQTRVELRLTKSVMEKFIQLDGGDVAANVNFTGTLTKSGSVVWHAGNDGAGSGLDADLLDGLSSTAFAVLASQNNFTVRQRITVTGAQVEFVPAADSVESYLQWYQSNGSTARAFAGFGSANNHFNIANQISGGNIAVTTTGGGAFTFGGNAVLTTVSDVNASNIGSGTIPDARIQATGVTQHLPKIGASPGVTIQSDPGGTPSGSAGDMFFFY